jgi:hypothetical protein
MTDATNVRTYLQIVFAALAFGTVLSADARGKVALTWDFTKGVQGWRANQYVEETVISSEGLAFRSTGNDPWIEGPAVDLPGEGMTRVRVSMKSNADAHAELFYGKTFQAGRSVRFTVLSDGQWHDYSVLIHEPLGPGTRFRLDPAASEGPIVVRSIQIEILAPIQPPAFERPSRPHGQQTTAPASVSSGEVMIEHHQTTWGNFAVMVDGEEMAAGYHAERIGMMADDRPEWLKLGEARFDVVPETGAILSRATLKDSRDGQWELTRRFRAGTPAGTIVVETAVTVDRDTDIILLPWLTLFPGLGTFGERKTQGLFAGLEYLADEPSSSEADITTTEHIRRAPDPLKITFPLMAITHDDRYLGLIWEPSHAVAAVFDSPDRLYNSGAHVMALSAPGIGEDRFENALVAHTPFRLAANQPLRVRAILIGGKGKTAVPAVQKYVELRGVPGIPTFEGGFDAAVKLLAHGWLDSTINEGGIFRHAVWGESFRAGPAGDALMYMDWLVNHADDPTLADRLAEGRDLGVTRMPRGQPYASTVSHTRTPTAPFVFGGIYPYVDRRTTEAKGLLTHFDEQGIKLYQPGKVDYGRTHFARHANGHAGVDVVRILEAATLSGDPDLIEQGLALLDKHTTLYANTVPRGAQVWEVPLHTPDILASAHMVKAYTLGYLISGKQEYLEQAGYWAWTGVPFVYLVNPTEGRVGPYATIAVLGATNWKAPSWFGRPVQWCGLVYASALHLLSQQDKEGPWETIAKGITATGLQMTWPVSDEKRQGLLPDFFYLREQLSDGPAINPGTVQAHVPELFDKGTLYDVKRLSGKGWFIHAPCEIRTLREAEDSVSFVVDGWGKKVFYVLLSGIAKQPARITARSAGTDSPREASAHFNPQQRTLAITLTEASEIELRF